MEDAAEIEQITSLALSQNVSASTMQYLGGPWSYANSPQLVNQYNFLNTATHVGSISWTKAPWELILTSYSADSVGQPRMWLQEVRLRLYAQVLDHWDIPPNNHMSVEQAFLLETRAGGLALQRTDIVVLVEGAKADLVVFDGNSPNMLGWNDPVAAVILHSNPEDVEHVLVNGEFRKRDFKPVVPGSLAQIQQRFLASAKRIKDIWKQMPPPVLEGSFPYTLGVNSSEAVTADVVLGWENGYLSS